jgi:hypothetical protein
VTAPSTGLVPAGNCYSADIPRGSVWRSMGGVLGSAGRPPKRCCRFRGRPSRGWTGLGRSMVPPGCLRRALINPERAIPAKDFPGAKAEAGGSGVEAGEQAGGRRSTASATGFGRPSSPSTLDVWPWARCGCKGWPWQATVRPREPAPAQAPSRRAPGFYRHHGRPLRQRGVSDRPAPPRTTHRIRPRLPRSPRRRRPGVLAESENRHYGHT